MDEKDTNANLVEQYTMLFDEMLEQGNVEKCRALIAEIKDLDSAQAAVLEFELYDSPIIYLKA